MFPGSSAFSAVAGKSLLFRADFGKGRPFDPDGVQAPEADFGAGFRRSAALALPPSGWAERP